MTVSEGGSVQMNAQEASFCLDLCLHSNSDAAVREDGGPQRHSQAERCNYSINNSGSSRFIFLFFTFIIHHHKFYPLFLSFSQQEIKRLNEDELVVLLRIPPVSQVKRHIHFSWWIMKGGRDIFLLNTA